VSDSRPGARPRVLVVDDDRAVRDSLRRSLEFNGYDVVLAADGAEGLVAVGAQHPDVVVIDVMMPRLDGIETTRALRAAGNDVPILVLTARDAVGDRVEGLDAGADDYLTKPFALEELVARVKAMLRRRQQVAPLSFQVGNLCVDVGAARVSVGGNTIGCTSGEFRLLSILAERKGAVMSRDELADAAFGPFAELTANTVEVAIHRLRRRLREAGSEANVVNHRGVGYALSLVATEKP